MSLPVKSLERRESEVSTSPPRVSTSQPTSPSSLGLQACGSHLRGRASLAPSEAGALCLSCPSCLWACVQTLPGS